MIAGCAAMMLAGHADARQRPTSVASYDRIANALLSGKDTTVIVDFAHCSASDRTLPPLKIKAGLHIHSFIIPDGKFIAFSDVHSTLDRSGAMVTEYLRYHVNRDNTVEVDHSTLAGNGNGVGVAAAYTCKIGDGVHFTW